MKYTAIIVALLVAVGMAFADQVTDNRNDAGPKVAHGQGSNPVTVRTGGETIATATPIATLPYSDVASTCGAINNYDEICPYGPATSPDVVYSYSPTVAEVLTVQLCDSYYDTKLFVYQDSYTPGVPYACNDDGCAGPNYPYAWLSTVTISVTPGHTYYFVVDGYGGGCGTYVLLVEPLVTCDITCPPGLSSRTSRTATTATSIAGTVAATRLRTSSSPFARRPARRRPSAARAARTCTLATATATPTGSLLRDRRPHDHDGLCRLPRAADLIYGTDCLYPTYNYTTAAPYVEASLSYVVGSGSYAWIWVGPSSFYGIPCGSNYLLTMDGIGTGPDCPPIGNRGDELGRDQEPVSVA